VNHSAKNDNDPHYIKPSRIASHLKSEDQQKVLKDLRQFAYDSNPGKVRAAVIKNTTGHIKPLCEAIENEIL
jgi:hypothetical protein